MAKNSPLKQSVDPVALGTAVSINPIFGALALFGGLFGKKKKRKSSGGGSSGDLARAQADFERRISDYEESRFQPIDADMLKRENVYEDLTIDTEAADYAIERFQQQQANIMQGLRGVAGASGAAGLAQALSKQAAQQTEQTRVTLSQQERENEKLRLAQQSKLQDQQRAIELANMQGAREFELDKLTTLLGVRASEIAGIRQQISNEATARAQRTGNTLEAISTALNIYKTFA